MRLTTNENGLYIDNDCIVPQSNDIITKLGQLEDIMEKYDINSPEELEHIILNDATGEQAFKDYCDTTGHQHLNCEKVGLIKTDKGYGLVNTDLFPYDKESNEECKKNLISSNVAKDLEVLDIIKKKLVNILAFVHFDSLECYNLACVKGRELTEAEFNLIKEWIER